VTRLRSRAAALAAAVGALTAACGGAGPVAPSPAARPAEPAAVVRRCHDYVVAEASALQSSARTFTDAVRAGDVGAAKAAYVPARAHYEAIAWVTDSYEEVAAAIDGQAGDAPNPARWTGFHRIEKALWADGSLAGMTPYANALDLDIMELKARVARQAYRPVDMAVGMGDLLTTISTSTLPGRENPYAHSDLADLAAGIGGAEAVYDLLAPQVAAENPHLATQIRSRFAAVTATLDAHRQGPGYADYATVPAAARRALSDAVDALAEPLSEVGAVVSGPT
jgi:iron uptake system component EfeO